MGQSDRITLLTPNWWRSEKSKFFKLNKGKNENLKLKGEKLDYNICMELDCNAFSRTCTHSIIHLQNSIIQYLYATV